MTDLLHGAVRLAETTRGGRVESVHLGHAVIADARGIVAAHGNPEAVIFPRSAVKMLQALPLLESGAGDALTSEQLALACASHNGAEIHTSRVRRWLADLDLSEADLRCGPQIPDDREARAMMRETCACPDQTHNNCSGKHAGFLTLNRHLGGGPDYIEPDHPVQRAVRRAFEEICGEESPGYGIDGCSAPNFAISLGALAGAMARMAKPGADRRGAAAARLVQAMAAHPELVAGEGRACTRLMRAMKGTVVKTGAEGVFTAILPSRGLGIALKVLDGNPRGSEAAIAALLVALGQLDRDDPVARRYSAHEQLNRRGIPTGELRAAEGLFAPL